MIDIALIAISVLVIFFSIKKGFLRSVFGLVAWVLAVVVILKFSMPIAETIFNNFAREKLIDSISEKLTNDYAYGTAQSKFDVFAVSISHMLETSSNLLGVSLNSGIENLNTANLSADKVAEIITDTYLATIVMYFIKWIVSIIGFIVLVIFFNFIGRALATLIRKTPLRSADKALGGVVGIIKAFVIVVIISALLQISTGLVYSNNAIKSFSKDKYENKKSNYTSLVEDSKIVEFMNENSPINKSLYKW